MSPRPLLDVLSEEWGEEWLNPDNLISVFEGGPFMPHTWHLILRTPVADATEAGYQGA